MISIFPRPGLYFFFMVPFRYSNGLPDKIFLEHRVASNRVVNPAPRFAPSAPIASVAMQDLTMFFFTAVFFAIAFLYVKACQKLR